MANSGLYDFTHSINEGSLDQVCGQSRTRATGTQGPVNPSSVNTNLGINYMQGIGTPVSLTSGSAFTLTAAQMGTGIVVLKPTASVNLNFDTAANVVTYFNNNSAGAVVGDVLQVLIINGASAFTLAPQAANGITFDANQSNTTIAANTSRLMYFRLTNVTGGSEAIVAYW